MLSEEQIDGMELPVLRMILKDKCHQLKSKDDTLNALQNTINSLTKRMECMESDKNETSGLYKERLENYKEAQKELKEELTDAKEKQKAMIEEAASKEPLFLEYNAISEPINVDEKLGEKLGASPGEKIDFFNKENTKKAKEILLAKIEEVKKEMGSEIVKGPSRTMMAYPCFYYEKTPHNGSLKISFFYTMNGKKKSFISKPKSTPTSVKEHLEEIWDKVGKCADFTENEDTLMEKKRKEDACVAEKNAKAQTNRKRKAEAILKEYEKIEATA